MSNKNSTIKAALSALERFERSESVIPEGQYCYTVDRVERAEDGIMVRKITCCPYWACDPSKDRQQNGLVTAGIKSIHLYS